MKKIGRKLLALIFPPKCIFCQNLVQRGEESAVSTRLCRACEDAYVFRAGDTSFAAKLAGTDYIVAALSYTDEAVAKAMKRYKFDGKRFYGKVFGDILAASIERNEVLRRSLQKFDVVTAVPVSKKRENERGYNQSAIIAKRLSEFLALPYEELLIKERHTKRQSSFRSLGERADNIRGAYAVRRPLAGEKVLLVDDIYTTGATMHECSLVLLGGGAKKVVGVCAVIQQRFDSEEERERQFSIGNRK